MLEALKIYSDRSAQYGDLWRQYGARAAALESAKCTDRVMRAWWFGDGVMLDRKHGDDALDGINYLVFFLRNARDGNIDGTPPERPDDV